MILRRTSLTLDQWQLLTPKESILKSMSAQATQTQRNFDLLTNPFSMTDHIHKPSLHECWNTMPCPDSDQLEHMHTAGIHAKIGLEFKTKTTNDSASDIMRPDAWSMTASTSQGIHFREHLRTSDTNTEALCFIAHKDELQLGAPDKCSQYDRP